MKLTRIQKKNKIKLIKTLYILITILIITFLISVPPPLLADYLWPLKEKTYLTGIFGEFRKNHIHAGIDISTKKKTGLPLYASESGNLYRVKTQYVGFGKTVYLRLIDGKFLVYAHLDRFSPKIEKIVKSEQIAQNKYEVDIYPKSTINVNKGELLGYSGDTGGVMPHLHLELRDKNERPLNILKNGLNVSDKNSPIISGLAICDPLTSFSKAYYTAKDIQPITVSGEIGLALSVYEKSHGNKLGVYQIDLIVDGKLFFRVKMNSFSYDEFRDNFFVYNKDLYVNHKKIYYNLFRTFNNKLPFYPLKTDGILCLSPGEHTITIKAIDYDGNTSKFNTTIIAKPQPQGKTKIQKKIKTGPWFSKDSKCSVRFDKLYSPVDIKIKTISGSKIQKAKEPVKELVPESKVYEIGPKETVFKKAFISITSPSETTKIGLYRLDNGEWKCLQKDNTSRTLGKFCLFKDTTPPEIEIISPAKAKITDSGSGLDYEKLALYLDDKKLIAEYSVNKKELFYNEKLPTGKHKITWIAIDNAGNLSKEEMNI